MRKEPFAALNFYIGLLVPILAPIVVAYNLFYVPFTQHIFPTTFLVGLLLMSLMMSIAQLFFLQELYMVLRLFVLPVLRGGFAVADAACMGHFLEVYMGNAHDPKRCEGKRKASAAQKCSGGYS